MPDMDSSLTPTLTRTDAVAALTGLESLAGPELPLPDKPPVPKKQTTWGVLTFGDEYNPVPLRRDGHDALPWMLARKGGGSMWAGEIDAAGTVTILRPGREDERTIRRAVARHAATLLTPEVFDAHVRYARSHQEAISRHRIGRKIAELVDSFTALHTAQLRHVSIDLPAQQRQFADQLIDDGFTGSATDLLTACTAAMDAS